MSRRRRRFGVIRIQTEVRYCPCRGPLPIKCTELESGGSGCTEVHALKFTNDPSAGSPTERVFHCRCSVCFHKLISQLLKGGRPYLKQGPKPSPTIIWPVNSIHTPKRLGLGCGLPISLVRDHTLNFYYTQGY